MHYRTLVLEGDDPDKLDSLIKVFDPIHKTKENRTGLAAISLSDYDEHRRIDLIEECWVRYHSPIMICHAVEQILNHPDPHTWSWEIVNKGSKP